MSTVQSLRMFVNERLTAAAEEILGVFEKTVVVYEEEIDRQRKLLDIVLKPQIKLHRADLPPLSVCKEELLLDQQQCNQESHSSLGQEVPEPPQIKEEQEEVYSCQEGEQPLVQEEADVFKLTRTSEGSDHSEYESLHSDPDQSQSAAEEEPVANISFRLNKPETDREDCGVLEPNSDGRLHPHNHHVAESEGYKTSSCGSTGSTGSTEPKQQNRPYKCESCSKTFSDLKKFRCDTCGKEFIYMSCLKKHVRTHTGEKPFRCKDCGKRFSCHSNYTSHVRFHTGEKPYSCNTCGKVFAWHSALTEHLKVHTGEKPYKCTLCGKRFTFNFSLTRHTRIHTGERPFKCNTCGKAFTQSTTLKTHMRTHTGERPYRCSTCGKSYSRSPDLKKHILKNHTGSASSTT